MGVKLLLLYELLNKWKKHEKKFRRILREGYVAGCAQLNLTTTTTADVEFVTNGKLDLLSGDISGCLDSKFYLDEFGITVVDKWKGADGLNSLATEVTFQDYFWEGFKVVACGMYVPREGDKDADIKAQYLDEQIGLNIDFTKLVTNPAVCVSGAFVVNEDLMVGAWFNSEKDTKFAMQYIYEEDLYINVQLDNFTELSVSMAAEVQHDIDVGVQVGWSRELGRKSFFEEQGIFGEIGAKFEFWDFHTLRFKMSSEKYAAWVYSNQIYENLGVTVGYKMDFEEWNNFPCSFGCGVTIEL